MRPGVRSSKGEEFLPARDTDESILGCILQHANRPGIDAVDPGQADDRLAGQTAPNRQRRQIGAETARVKAVLGIELERRLVTPRVAPGVARG